MLCVRYNLRMKIIFSFILIVFLVFSGYHLSFRRMKLPIFARRFYLTGIEFLFLGLLLGPQLLNILDSATQEGLTPLSTLVLGWVGLLYGFQFELAKLRRLPMENFTGALITGGVTAAVVFLGAWWGLPKIFYLPRPMNYICAMTVAAAAACTAQVSIALTPRANDPGARGLAQLLQYISSADGALGILLFAAACLFRPASPAGISSMGIWPGVAVSIGIEFFLFILFLNKRLSYQEVIIVVIGMSIMGSGTASMLGFSPLAANFFTGVLLVNFCRDKERIYGLLAAVEKPAYILLLVFLGASWAPDAPVVFWGACIYFILRVAGKAAGGFLMIRLVSKLRDYPPFVGLGLVDHGGIALAILLDLSLNFTPEMVKPVVSLALVGVILNEIAGPVFLSLVFRKGGK